ATKNCQAMPPQAKTLPLDVPRRLRRKVLMSSRDFTDLRYSSAAMVWLPFPRVNLVRKRNPRAIVGQKIPATSAGTLLKLHAVLTVLIWLASGANIVATSAYPLKTSANGRYVMDSNNVPFLIIGDAPHSILANLNNSDAVTYLADRGQRGFNAL